MEVSKSNGLYPTVLISSGLKNPSDLALDPQTGYVINYLQYKYNNNLVISQ